MPASPYETRQKAKGHRKNGLSSLERPCECRKQKEELPAKVSGGKVAIEIAVVEGRAAIDHNPAADKRPANAHADEVPVARRPVAIGPISRDPCVSRSRARRNISYRPANADVDPDARCLCRRCAQSKGRDCQCRSQHPFLNAAHNPFIPGEPAFGSPPVRHHLWGLVSAPWLSGSAHFKHRQEQRLRMFRENKNAQLFCCGRVKRRRSGRYSELHAMDADRCGAVFYFAPIGLLKGVPDAKCTRYIHRRHSPAYACAG